MYLLNFFLLISLQFIFLLFVAYKKKRLKELTVKKLLINVILGIIFGIFADLIVGKYLGIFKYALGFELPFIILNGALSYGIMIATVALLNKESLLRFYFWTILLGVVYEISNYLFPVWSWTFLTNKLLQEAIILFAAYTGLALLIVAFLLITTRTRFFDSDNKNTM